MNFQRLWGSAEAPRTLQDEFLATLGCGGGTTHLTTVVFSDFGARRQHHTPYKMNFQRLCGSAEAPRTLQDEFLATLGCGGGTTHLTRCVFSDFGARRQHHAPC